MMREAKRTTPYVLLGSEGKARLTHALEAATHRWQSVWCVKPGTQCSVRYCDDRAPLRDTHGARYRVSANGAAIIDISFAAATLTELTHLPLRRFAASASTMRTDGLADELLAAIARSLAEEVMDSASIETWDLERRDGPADRPEDLAQAHRVVIIVGGREIAALAVSAQLVEMLVPRRAVPVSRPLEPRSSAIGDARVVVEAVLGSVEIPLTALVALERGDVLMIDAAIDGPCTLEIPEIGTIGSALLGRRGKRRAVQLQQLTSDKEN